MKLTLASLMLLAATSSFAFTTYTFHGVNPLDGNVCHVSYNIEDNGSMGYFEIRGGYKSTEYLPKNITIYDDGNLYHSFAGGGRHTSVPEGLVQTPTLSSNRMLFKLNDDIGKLSIDLKGKSLDKITSVTYNFNYGIFQEKQLSRCNDLFLTEND